MTFEPVFEIGSMPGLMDEFSRHSGIMTNFSISKMESRLYGPEAGILSAGSRWCAEGSSRDPGVPPVGAEAWLGYGLGPGSTNVAGWEDGWVVPTRYTTLPVPTPCTHPVYRPPVHPMNDA